MKHLPSNAGDMALTPGPGAGSFPSGSVGKESACNARDPGSIAESRRSPREGNGNPLQYSCLENPMAMDNVNDDIIHVFF